MTGQPILCLRLEGPLQSWGLRARWDVRDSGDEPSKSGVVGLLGCALGYPVYDQRLEALDRELVMGVRVENEGRKLVDFQTITGVLPTADGGSRGSADNPYTIISPRTYLQDAAFLIALSGPEDLLVKCRTALSAPQWPSFLGRKSCPPARPIFEAYTHTYSGLEDVLRRYPWSWGGSPAMRSTPQSLRCILEDPAGEAIRPDRLRTNPARMYENRRVRVFQVGFPGAAEEDEPCTSHA